MSASVFVPPLDLPAIRAILFDMDGTLADTDDVYALGFHRAFAWLLGNQKAERFGRWLVHFLEAPGNFFLTAADWLGLDGLLARFLDWSAHRASEGSDLEKKLPLVSAIRPMLQQITERYKVALVSTRNQNTVQAFLNLHNLNDFFEVVVSSQTVSRTKPFPDPLLYAAERLGEPIQACLMVGDTVVDVRAARAAGAQSLSVLCGFGSRAQLERAGTQAVLRSTSDLAAYLSAPLG